MKKATVLFILATVGLMTSPVFGGVEMTADFHFKFGHRYAFKLTPDQVAQLESHRKGKERIYNVALGLTPEQTDYLLLRTGNTVTEFMVFEKGWHDCACHAWNIASRFCATQVEVTTDLLMDTAILKWQETAPIEASPPSNNQRKHWWQFWREKQ